jgi:hypothetical protein
VDNASGQYILSREQAEAIVSSSAGVYAVQETTVTVGANSVGTIAAANPRRISLGFQCHGGTCKASTVMPSVASPAGLTLVAESLFFYRYFQDGILCAYPWYFVNTGVATSIWVIEVIVI